MYMNKKTFEMKSSGKKLVFNVWIKDEEYFEVDDSIARTIQILNQRGYKTTYCCGGHSCFKFVRKSGSTHIYIMFDEIIDFENLPKNFKSKQFERIYNKEGDAKMCTIVERVVGYDENTTYEQLENKLFFIHKNLRKWALELRKRDDKDVH